LTLVPPLGADLSVAPVLDSPPSPSADTLGPPDLLDGLLADDEDTLSLVLDGAVDGSLEPDLAQMLTSLRTSSIRHVVLELASVTAMDVTGLRFLLAVQGLALERGGSIRFADLPDVVLELIAESGAGSALALGDGDGDPAVGGWSGARPA
jgi:anti-anti-sigma factor